MIQPSPRACTKNLTDQIHSSPCSSLPANYGGELAGRKNWSSSTRHRACPKVAVVSLFAIVSLLTTSTPGHILPPLPGKLQSNRFGPTQKPRIPSTILPGSNEDSSSIRKPISVDSPPGPFKHVGSICKVSQHPTPDHNPPYNV